LAAAIVSEAKTASLNLIRDVPFAKAVQKEYPYDPFHGGKIDDISALVVITVDRRQLAQPMKAKL
jgi:protein phosphatase PTC7